MDSADSHTDHYGGSAYQQPSDVTPENDNDQVEVDKCCSIDRFMIPAKLSHFFTISREEIDNYLVLFFMSLGFNTVDAGMIGGLQYIGGFVGLFGWSYIADRFRIHKTLVVILGTMAIISTSILPILGIPFGDQSRYRCPYKMNETLLNNNEYYGSRNQTVLFYCILFMAMIGKSFDASLTSFINTGCLYRVNMSPKKANYGGQRCVGELGVGFAGLAYSLSITLFPLIKMSCESGIFIVYALVVIALILSSCWLFNGVEITHENNKSKHLNQVLKSTLIKPENIFFLVTVLVGGIIQGLYFNFLFVYLKELEAEPIIFGLQTCVVAISGGIAYYCSKRIIGIVKGTMTAMGLSCFAWSLRFFCVSLIDNPIYILPIEIIHGLTYSLFFASAIEHVDEISDPLILTTMCGILNALFIQLGSLTANIVGGKLYDLYGGRRMIIICSLVCLAWGFLVLCFAIAKWLRKNNTISLETTDNESPVGTSVL